MLQPVKTVPSAVSSAAPTLNRENAASACSRARRAAATRSTPSGAIAQAAWSEPSIAVRTRRRMWSVGVHHPAS